MAKPCNFTLEIDEPDEDSSSSPFYWWKSIPQLDKPSSTLIKLLREMERLYCMITEQDDLKHKLMVYKSGDFWLPIGGIKKEDMDIPPVITILLLGLSGSGKSSLVNLMYSVLGRSGLIPFSRTSNESSNYSTKILEEHNVLRSSRNGFCVYDSGGFDCNRMEEGLEEVRRWMTDGVRHNQPCGGGDDCSSGGFVKRRVNQAVVVANLAEIHDAFFCGGDLKSVLAIKSLFHCPSIMTPNIEPLLILTHGDMLLPVERLNARIKICNYLEIPATTGAYDITCLTEQGILPEESDPVTCFALTEAIYRVLLQSDRTHFPKKTYKDCIVHILSLVMYSLACFFAMLSHVFQEFSDRPKRSLD